MTHPQQAEAVELLPNQCDWDAAFAFEKSVGGVDTSLLAEHMRRHRQAAETRPAQAGTGEVVAWSADRGMANSHCMDDQLLADGECVGFMREEWTDRILTALYAHPALAEQEKGRG